MDSKKNVPPEKKIGRFMTITLGLTMSIVLGTLGVVSSGHFSISMWIISLVLSIALAMIIGFLFPVQPIRKMATAGIQNKLLKSIAGNAIVNFVYVLIITTVLLFVMITLAKHQMDVLQVPESVPRPSFIRALPFSLIKSYIVSYVITFILGPIYLKIAFKRYLSE